MVACNSSQRSFIEETFGDIDIIHLDGYNVTYSGWNRLAQAGLLTQLPRIRKTIVTEHTWLRNLCDNRQIDGIISDNRYGLYHDAIPSVIMTHQLMVRSGMGRVADLAVQTIHYQYLNRFRETWVVDAPGATNLGGALSHPARLPERTKYIGLLSQFEEASGGATNTADGPLLILLSGPEPQRTVLSEILWQQLLRYDGQAVFVAGSNDAPRPGVIPPNISYHNRLTRKELAPLMQAARVVICRSGYSTIMDLVALHKTAILLPTPGQTEQEYLGRYLHDQALFFCSRQDGFNLHNALTEIGKFRFCSVALQGAFTGYKKIIDEWIELL